MRKLKISAKWFNFLFQISSKYFSKETFYAGNENYIINEKFIKSIKIIFKFIGHIQILII